MLSLLFSSVFIAFYFDDVDIQYNTITLKDDDNNKDTSPFVSGKDEVQQPDSFNIFLKS